MDGSLAAHPSQRGGRLAASGAGCRQQDLPLAGGVSSLQRCAVQFLLTAALLAPTFLRR